MAQRKHKPKTITKLRYKIMRKICSLEVEFSRKTNNLREQLDNLQERCSHTQKTTYTDIYESYTECLICKKRLK